MVLASIVTECIVFLLVFCSKEEKPEAEVAEGEKAEAVEGEAVVAVAEPEPEEKVRSDGADRCS